MNCFRFPAYLSWAFDHTHISRKIGSRGVLIFSHKRGHLLSNIVMIGEAFVLGHAAGPVLELSLERIESLLGFDFAHAGDDPLLEFEPKPLLDVVRHSDRP
jgi:hypothetical protein